MVGIMMLGRAFRWVGEPLKRRSMAGCGDYIGSYG